MEESGPRLIAPLAEALEPVNYLNDRRPKTATSTLDTLEEER